MYDPTIPNKRQSQPVLYPNAVISPTAIHNANPIVFFATHVLFLNTLPVPAVVAACDLAAVVAGAFFVAVVPAPTPFLIVLITVLFAAGAFDTVPAMAVAGRFLTTVDVLPSLDSLMALTLRAVRVAGRVGGGAAAPLFALVAVVVVVVELDVVDVVVLRPVAAARVDFAFSTMLLSMFVAAAILVGDAGRAMPDLVGEGGRSRGARRELDEAGESTWPGLRLMSAVAGPARAFFLGNSIEFISFSLSPPDISLLGRVNALSIRDM